MFSRSFWHYGGAFTTTKLEIEMKGTTEYTVSEGLVVLKMDGVTETRVGQISVERERVKTHFWDCTYIWTLGGRFLGGALSSEYAPVPQQLQAYRLWDGAWKVLDPSVSGELSKIDARYED